MDYISTTELDYFLLGADAAPIAKKNLAIGAASRLFDIAANVPENFFAKVREIDAENPNDDGTDVKVIAGNGTAILRLPPFVGPVGLVGYENDDEPLSADGYAVKGDAPNQFLVFGYFSPYKYWFTSLSVAWIENKNYTVRARWGFPETPSDVKTAVIQMAISLLSDLDTAKARRLGAKSDDKNHLPENSFAAITAKKYRQQMISPSGF